MKERHRRRIRRAFEPNRFAAEQLVKIYEELKPVESRTIPTSSPLPEFAIGKCSSAKGGEQ